MSRQGIRKKIKKEADQLLRKLLSAENISDRENMPTTSSISVSNICDEMVQKNKELSACEIDANSKTNAACSILSDIATSGQKETNTVFDELVQKNKDALHTDSSLRQFLSEWSIKYAISGEAMNELLKKLKSYDTSLPVDVRTLRDTPKNTSIIEMGKGTYFHYGLENCLTDFMYQTEISDDTLNLKLNFGIDGLPLFKSSKKCLWPIMLSISQYESVFLVGVYINVDINQSIDKYSKPNDPNIFLKYLVEDLKNLMENGFIFKNKMYTIDIGHFVCDAPARAFVLNVKSHSGFYCCTKCCQKGEYFERRITFPECSVELRTDESFKNRTQKEHHTKIEPGILESINICCVSQFTLDYMHIVCLGVTKHMLKLWTKKKGKDFSLNSDQILAISKGNVKLSKQFCAEFNRVPRTLDELDRWKASEYRSFLLYTSIIVLKNVLHDSVYTHFCKLHIGLRILCDKNLCSRFNYQAECLLKEYIAEVPSIYGQENLSYNMHSLSHLAEEVVKNGCLDNFSAFKFENFLYKLKKTVKKGSNILAQISNRVVEQSICLQASSKVNFSPILKGKANDNFYTSLKTRKETYSIKEPNNFVEFNGTPHIIRKIYKNSNDILFTCNEVINIDHFFNLEQNLSQSLGIFKSEQYTYSDVDIELAVFCIKRKYVRFQFENLSVFVPLL